jgi:bacillopeptidase F (M6 metalloprotease family)
LANPIALAVGTNATLEFNHRYQTEQNWDGGVLEYSLDGGTTWTDILAAQGGVVANPARMLSGGYVSVLSGTTNALGGRPAWHGSIATFQQTRVRLTDFGGRSLLIRFRMGTDNSVGGNGWWIDDIRVAEGSTCEATSSNRIFADGFGN